MVSLRRHARAWGTFIAAGLALCLIVGIAAWNLQPQYPEPPTRDNSYAPDHAYEAGGHGCDPDDLRLLANDAYGASQRSRCADAEQDEQRNKATLSEARYASNIAQQQLFVAQYQGWVFFWQSMAAIGAFVAAVFAALFAGSAAYHTKRSADAAADAQRPWLAISCEVEELEKTANTVSYRVLVSCYNTGDTAAVCFNFQSKAEVFFEATRDPVEKIWNDFKSDRSENHLVLLPKETIGETPQVWARTDLEGDKPGTPISCVLIVVAAAYFKFSDRNEWHSTERSFNIGLRLKPDTFLRQWIDPDVPNRNFLPEEINVRQIFAGQTS